MRRKQTPKTEPAIDTMKKLWQKEQKETIDVMLRAGLTQRAVVERLQEVKLYDFPAMGALYDEYKRLSDATR